jgi:glycogen(starch) synthase
MIFEEQPIRKILMTADTVGGVWTYALDLCRAFHSRGIQVCLATMGAPLSSVQRSDAGQIQGLDIRESSYKLEWMEDAWNDIDQAGEWLLNIEKEVEPDIIHLNGYTHAALKWHTPVIVVAHSCVLSWWQSVKKQEAPTACDEYKHRVQQGLKAADAVVAISHSYADELNKLYGPLVNMQVIYNGRDPSLFYTANKRKQVFAMGRIWDEAKNLSILSLIANKAKLPVLIAGDNRHPDAAEAIHILNVELLGVLSQAEIRARLAESYIYILPAKYEPFGLSVLEAALSGCVLLLADIPTLKELWQDTALYFDPNQPQELDKLLDHVLQHPEIGSQLIERSKERARLFSLEKMTNNYLILYQSLVYKQLETK